MNFDPSPTVYNLVPAVVAGSWDHRIGTTWCKHAAALARNTFLFCEADPFYQVEHLVVARLAPLSCALAVHRLLVGGAVGVLLAHGGEALAIEAGVKEINSTKSPHPSRKCVFCRLCAVTYERPLRRKDGLVLDALGVCGVEYLRVRYRGPMIPV